MPGAYPFHPVFNRLGQEEDALERHSVLHVPRAARPPVQETAPGGPGVRPVVALRIPHHQRGIVAQRAPRGREPIAGSGLSRPARRSQDHTDAVPFSERTVYEDSSAGLRFASKDER